MMKAGDWWLTWALIMILCGLVVTTDDGLYPDISNYRTSALPSHYCHNMCSGHGRCQNDDVCYCSAEYNTSLTPDCSWRVCPSGAAWSDKAYGVDTAHSQKECSGGGKCNRYTGSCECFDGYTGKACERMDCPRKCSGHGECYTMATLQNLYNFSHTTNDVYGVWDANKVMGCACDLGYTGGACEVKMCPKGHDPLIEQNSSHRIVIRTFSESGALSGNFKLYFMGKSFEFNSVVASFGPTLCKNKFESLPGVRSVTCSHNATDYAHGGAGYFVDFTGWPTNPQENNIFSHNGRPLSEFFHCDTTNVSNSAGEQVHCNVFTGVLGDQSDYVIRYDYCSKRGICNLDSGECDCYQNFYGAACEVYVPHTIYEDYVDVMTISANDTDFTDTVLRIQDTIRGDAGDWSSLYLETNEYTFDSSRTAMFNITSDGDVIQSRGGWQLSGKRDGLTGVTIHTGGLHVTGGITIDSEGLEIVNKGVAGDVRFHGAGNINGGLVFDDTLSIGKPGLTATGGLTIHTGGLVVPDCLTPVQGRENTFGVACLRPKGIYVGAGGADFYHGAYVTSGMNVTGGLRMGEWRTTGVTVETGGLDVFSGGMTVWYKGMVVDRASWFEDGVTVTGGVTITGGYGLSVSGDVGVTGGMQVGNKAYVKTGGATVTGTMSVYSGGMVSYDGEMDILAGGLQISSPNVDGGMMVKEGLSIAQDPASPSSDGLRVTLGGITVEQGAVMVTGGVTVGSGGLVSSNDGPVNIVDGGLQVTGGLSQTDHSDIFSAGRLRVTGGMTVFDTGVRVSAGGVTVASQGMLVSDTGVDLTITQGMRVQAGGLTVASSGGLDVSLGTVINRGPEAVTVVGGASVGADGVVFTDIGADHYLKVHGIVSVTTGGMLVAGKGMNITAGVSHVKLNGLSVNVPRASVDDAYDPKTSSLSSVTSADAMSLGGGLTATGGITVSSTGLAVNSAVELTAGGWGNVHEVTGGFTAAGGIDVSAGGLQIDGVGASVVKDATVKDGVTVGGRLMMRGVDGVRIYAGGLTITTGGLHIITNNNDEANTIHNLGTHWMGGMTFGGKLTTSGGLYFRGGGARSDVEDDGGTITEGGMTVAAGGVSADSAQFTIRPWSAVHSGQHHEQRDAYAIDVTGGVTIGAGGLRINNPRGPEAFGTDIIEHKPGIKYGLTFSDPDNTFGAHSGLYVTADGVSVDAHGISVESDGVSVASGGMVVTSPVAVTVMDEGISVRSGGFSAGGTSVKINGGLSVVTEGMEVTGGLSIEEGGLVLSEGGNLVNSDTESVGVKVTISGLVVAETGGVDVQAGGVDVTATGVFVKEGGLTIVDTGILALKGGLTVSGTGIEVTTGGVTVLDGGLAVTGKIGGGDAKKGLVVKAGDMVIDHDLVVSQYTLSCSATASTSDRRLKTNVEALEPHDSLQKVRQLNGVYYYWNNSTSTGTGEAGVLAGRRVGLLAQEVQAVLPEAVHTLPRSLSAAQGGAQAESGDKEGYLGVRYDGVLPLLVEALRALSENVAMLWEAVLDTSSSSSSSAPSDSTTARQRLQKSIRELDSLLTTQEQETGALESLVSA